MIPIAITPGQEQRIRNGPWEQTWGDHAAMQELLQELDATREYLARALEDNATEYLRGRKDQELAVSIADYSWRNRALEAEHLLSEEIAHQTFFGACLECKRAVEICEADDHECADHCGGHCRISVLRRAETRFVR